MNTSFAMQPSDTFIEGLKTLVTPGLVARASIVVGEREAAVRNGLPAAVFTIFGTMAHHAADRSLMTQVLDLVGDTSVDGGGASGPLNVSSTTRGARLLNLLTSRNPEPMYKILARFAGVTQDTASSLLGIAAPLALGYVTRTVQRENLDVAGFSRLLLLEGSAVTDLVPHAISTAMGFRAHAAIGSRKVYKVPRGPMVWRWVMVLLLLLAAAWGFSYFFDGPTQEGFITRSLPGGVLVSYAGDGVESKLLDFIENSKEGLGKEVWFDFDRLLFEFDTAVLKTESQTQLRNVAVILMAYPNVHIKIGGYTDNSGVPSANVKLSEARARRVMQELTALGIGAGRLSAEGYGSNYSLDQNGGNSPKTRRVALRVTEK